MLQGKDTLMYSLLCGRLKAPELPLSLDLTGLHEAIEELWRRSAEQRMEWGGCLVLENGRLCVAHEIGGSEDAVSPQCKPEDHDTYVGFVHTHLEDKEMGKPYIGFSDRDYAASLRDGEHLSLVTNGIELFALVRTVDRTQVKQEVDEKKSQQWARLFDRLVRKAEGKGIAKLNENLWEANKELCQLLGFAFYQGRLGERLEVRFRPREELR